jgi:hypothetical protein
MLQEEKDNIQKRIQSTLYEFERKLRQQEQQKNQLFYECEKKIEEENDKNCELKEQIVELQKSKLKTQIDINDYISRINSLDEESRRSKIQYEELLRQYDELKAKQSGSMGCLLKYFFYLILLYLIFDFLFLSRSGKKKLDNFLRISNF